jgi:hypothetical protein
MQALNFPAVTHNSNKAHLVIKKPRKVYLLKLLLVVLKEQKPRTENLPTKSMKIMIQYKQNSFFGFFSQE